MAPEFRTGRYILTGVAVAFGITLVGVIALVAGGPELVNSILAPEPTVPMTSADVVGTWRFHDRAERADVDVRFLPDGRFEQKVRRTGHPLHVSAGTWQITDNKLWLENYWQRAADWQFDSACWTARRATMGMSIVLRGSLSPDPDCDQDIRLTER